MKKQIIFYLLIFLFYKPLVFSQQYFPKSKKIRYYESVTEADIKFNFYDNGEFTIPFNKANNGILNQDTPEKALISAFTNIDSIFYKVSINNNQKSFSKTISEIEKLLLNDDPNGIDEWNLQLNYKLSFEYGFKRWRLIRGEIQHVSSGYCTSYLVALNFHHDKWWVVKNEIDINGIVSNIGRLRLFDSNAIKAVINNKHDNRRGYKELIDHLLISKDPAIIHFNKITNFLKLEYFDLFDPKC